MATDVNEMQKVQALNRIAEVLQLILMELRKLNAR